ncbi:MAG: CotH kinase family protein [Mariniblastus sp.]|nr:CotH kinase family protein [Mariniblastus sp.]
MQSRLLRNSPSIILASAFALFISFAAPSPAQSQEKISSDSLFSADRISSIEIDIPQKDWDFIRQQSRSFSESLGKKTAESPFEYVRGDVTIDGRKIEDVGIRKKGFLGSLSVERPSLKLKFDKYKDQDPIEGVDRLTLNNNKQDPSRVCQYLSYKLFRESGTRSSRCGFARVSVNGKYLGIYSNVESVKPLFLEREFGDGTGDCFEGTITDFFPDWVKKFEAKNKKASYEDLKQVATALALPEPDLDQLNELLNLEAFIQFWAMESLIGFWDGYCSNQNNFFVYQNPSDSKFYFIPWGTDSAFTTSSPIPPYRIRPKSVHAKAILPNKLYRIPEIQSQYSETLNKFLDEHWNESRLLSEMDRLQTMLKEHAMPSNSKFSTSMTSIRSFIKNRRQSLLREFKDGPPELNSREKKPIYFAETGNVKITFSTQWFNQSPNKKSPVGDAQVEFSKNGKPISLSNVSVYAEQSKAPSRNKNKPPTIVITGKDQDSGNSLTIAVSISSENFKPSENNKVSVTGLFLVNGVFMPSQMEMIDGTAILDSASTEPGAPVAGRLELKIKKMKLSD